MKKIFLVGAGLVLCFSLASALGNAGPTPAVVVSFQNAQSPSNQNPQATKTFTGTVTKQGDIYILSDKADKTNYQLDDPKKVSEFEGKAVKVIGTLDAENLTIHVQSITEIA